MNAILLDNRIALTPTDKVTSHILDIARQNRDAIIAEINSLALAQATDQASDTMGAGLQQTKWADPRHDLDKLEHVLVALFAHCARLGWNFAQYWDGPPDPIPAQRPYCYVKPVLVDEVYLYWPMLADIDGIDYFWIIDDL